MKLEGEVGIHVGYDGTDNPLRLGRMGALVTTEGHGRYAEPTWRGGLGLSIGGLFSAANQAAVTSGVGLSATVATISLSNDLGSNKILAVNTISWAFSAAPAAATVVYLVGGFSASTNVTHTTPILVKNNYLGGAIGAGKADSGATLPAAPTVLLPLANVAAASSITPSMQVVDLAGQFFIPPGGYIAIQALTAAVGFGAIIWEELPL